MNALRLSVVIPATDHPGTLARCVAAVERASDRPEEIIVVDDSHIRTPAAARNAGVARATGDVLVFIDADVEVQHDVFRRIRAAFTDSALSALFGSYDDAPAAMDAVSGFRNLLHHYVHQNAPGPASTFWTGLGAIRRDDFEAVGGFDARWDSNWQQRFGSSSVEDIELGMRLAATGKLIVLDPSVQGTHLKRWGLFGTMRTDLLGRGVPWVVLLLRSRSASSALNLGWRHRLSAVSCLGLIAAVAVRRTRTAAGFATLFVGLNRSFYLLLARRRGPMQASAGVALHALHHLTGIAAVPIGVVVYLRQQAEHERGEGDDAGV